MFRGVEYIVSKRIRSLVFSQCMHTLSTGVMCSVLGVPVTTRASEFCNNWRREILFLGKLRF